MLATIFHTGQHYPKSSFDVEVDKASLDLEHSTIIIVTKGSGEDNKEWCTLTTYGFEPLIGFPEVLMRKLHLENHRTITCLTVK